MKELEEQNIEQLRSNYLLVRGWWKRADGWSDDDLVEADEGIKRALASGDTDLVARWQGWLVNKVSEIRRFFSEVRQMEARIRNVPFIDDNWPDGLMHGASPERAVTPAQMNLDPLPVEEPKQRKRNGK